MPEQVAERTVEHPAAARALMNVEFLGRFLEPVSPSEVARALGRPANLVHHHVRKCQRLGLLFEVQRTQGRVLYQLTARRFRVLRGRGGAADPRGSVFDGAVHQLAGAYLEAQRRSDALLNDQDEPLSIWAFEALDDQASPDLARTGTGEARPAFSVQRTLQLTPERYRRLLSRIERLIREEPSGADEPNAGVCTVAVLGFDGVAYEGLCADSLSRSSYFPPVQDVEP